MAAVTAPVVVILAAGQGTRMRSALPKLLHPVCGRPMIAWPVAAARDAGAGRIVIVDSPARALAGSLDDDVEVAIQERPNGTADAVRAAAGHIDPAGTVVVLAGDVPLITAETIRGLVDAHVAAGCGRHDGDHGARGSERIRARRAGTGRHRRAGGGDEGAR